MTTEKKTAYLSELRRLLATLPQEELEAALTYYGEYFDDAGTEETERVLNELGPARALAEQILSGYSRDYLDTLPSSSHAQVPARPEDAVKARHREEEAAKERQREEEARAETARTQASAGYRETAPPPRRSGASVLLIVLLAILALPMLLPLAALIFGLLMGLFALIFGLSLGAGALVLAVFVAGAVLLAAGLSMLFVNILEALMACGVGLMLLGVGCIMLLFCVFMFVKVAPAILRLFVRVLRWPFERRVARA